MFIVNPEKIPKESIPVEMICDRIVYYHMMLSGFLPLGGNDSEYIFIKTKEFSDVLKKFTEKGDISGEATKI